MLTHFNSEVINMIHGYLHNDQVSGFEIISRHTFNRPGTIDTPCSLISVNKRGCCIYSIACSLNATLVFTYDVYHSDDVVVQVYLFQKGLGS